MRLLWTQPPPEDTHPINAPVVLCFSGRLSPRSVHRGLASLSSGNRNYDSQLDFDLVDWRNRTNRQKCPGSLLFIHPPEDLAPHTRYRFRLTDRLRDWQGRPLSSEGDPRWVQRNDKRLLIIEYRTDDRKLAKPPAHTLIGFASLFEPGSVFGPDSASCYCHYRDGSFDLRDPQALYPKLRFGKNAQGQPWVTPGFPSQSYFLFKLLRDAQGHALSGVKGDPMPPQDPIHDKNLRQIARWIEDGALP